MKGRFSENVETQIARLAGSLTQYMLAALLVVALSKIKVSLKGSNFNANAMIFHTAVLIC
jgi:hypothetical protein